MYQGRTDEALKALEQAFEAGHRNAWELAAPLLDPLRDEPRFVVLHRKYETARRENRAAVLALICSDELPDIGWRPLPETCGQLAAAVSN